MIELLIIIHFTFPSSFHKLNNFYIASMWFQQNSEMYHTVCKIFDF